MLDEVYNIKGIFVEILGKLIPATNISLSRVWIYGKLKEQDVTFMIHFENGVSWLVRKPMDTNTVKVNVVETIAGSFTKRAVRYFECFDWADFLYEYETSREIERIRSDYFMTKVMEESQVLN